MTMFNSSIGAKLNLVFTDEPNDIISQTIFEGEVRFNDGVSGLDVSDISGINQYALQTALDAETLSRTNADTDLQNNINLKADQTALDAETLNRTNADTNLSLIHI